VDPLLAYAKTKQPEIVALVRELVECESPTDDRAAVQRFTELVADRLSGLAACRAVSGGARFGPHLLCDFKLPGRKKNGQILALGHSDTVWPLGTLRTMPYRRAEGRLWGPGALDMKAGVAFFIFAMRALRDLDLPVAARVRMQLNSDEEVGSDSSRALTEKNALASRAVLVLEPGTGMEGKVKTARKGVGDYTVTVRGRAAHAGVDFSAGASAILELARQLDRIAAFTDLARGITVNPGVISGGTRSNVIAAEARAEVDIRVPRLRDAPALDRKFRKLRPSTAAAPSKSPAGSTARPWSARPAWCACSARRRSWVAISA
jgi:glutamate carboxypeptidase